jgi:hypothetical protein
MNTLSAFGLFAVMAMVVCYALEERNLWFRLAFAVSCVLGSVYGFLWIGRTCVGRSSHSTMVGLKESIPQPPF